MYRELYSRFLAARPGIQHFACHSHHYWPDVTREATLQYWDDTARLADDKWTYSFTEKVPRAQQLIAANLNLSDPERIVFAPNTHEFVVRLLSCFAPDEPLRILTTDSEFYSFDRQINRLSESDHVEIVKVPVEPFADFHERFEASLGALKPQFVFFSHVFFNSGFVCDAERLSRAAGAVARMAVVDGYHGFMAVPTDLVKFDPRAFYLAGSYKYAQGGEGACFLVVPEGCEERPIDTGWFAELAELDRYTGAVGYPQKGLRFAGSTMDFTALYRLIAALELFRDKGLTVTKIHAHIRKQQALFLSALAGIHHPLLNDRTLMRHDPGDHGHFLTFRLPSVEVTDKLQKELMEVGFQTDSRGERLRFGFGLYHEGEYDLSVLRK
ncbi:MAG TPA: aminotransferase class V-fold PLP-dependent enzyme [Pseudobdellovibrionaceae bacterium]|nr:aminotransferase class V-fold PLP-dependent enzyme [Pseudobdellovibrionaceae bacterium]